MQDITILTRNPILTAPRVLRSDILPDIPPSDIKHRKFKNMPRKRQNRNCDYISSSSPDIPSTSRMENGTESEHMHSSNDKTYLSHMDRPIVTNEKPFNCKICDQSFVTNKGMKRHMRTHKRNNSQASDSDDSDEKSTVPPQIIEISKLPQKRKRDDANSSGPSESTTEDEQSTVRKKTKTINNNIIKDLKMVCPVCNMDDFASANILDIHIVENHPDFQIKCQSCNIEFKNHKLLNLHKFMIHNQDAKTNNSVSGFNDCTFIDFSSSKFPEIAKTVCEKSVHKSITDQKFRCNSCSRDFPCQSAMDIHARSCENSDGHSSSSNVEETDSQNDFMATLNLKTTDSRSLAEEYLKSKDNRQIKNQPQIVDNKDLADIQSILSVASGGGILDRLSHKTRNLPKDDGDEVQDVFAAEFRKMKLRGEFPCRLCTAIFPNLRALKGHNRVHLNGNSTGPYRCNMCPHSSLDKAALVRHMRTHNGDRPYECAVCNYAFTTKANCERHLRNRHSKISREDVKRSIIYHPSEDPNNDEINSKLNISRDEIKRSQLFGTPENGRTRDDMDIIKNERSSPINHFSRDSNLTFSDHGLPISIPRDLSIVIPQPRETLNSHCSIEPVTSSPSTAEDITPPRIKVKGFGQLTQIPEFTESENEKDMYSDEEIDPVDDSYENRTTNYSSEIPMDLSTGECQDDVLDLSKKRVDQDDKSSVKSHSDEYIKKTPEFNNNENGNIFEKNSMLFAQHPLFKYRKFDPNEIYAQQLSQMYSRAGAQFPGLGTFPYLLQPNPFLVSATPPSNMLDLGEIQKEIMRGLQMSGGGLVGMEQTNFFNTLAHAAKERFHALQQHQNLNNANKDANRRTPTIKTDGDVKPQHLHINIDAPTTIPYAPILSSPVVASPKTLKKDTISSHSPNSVKMVIKNGVLMPKQKQRRYRTERPFSCEHCSARFTLRSNMERHIKQQHPQFWSQRQRSSIGNLPRKNPLSLVPQNISMPQNITINYDNRLNYNKNASNENSQDEERKEFNSGNTMQKNYMISDQVKYAILAQQLKSQNAHTNNLAKNRIDPMANGENEDEDEEDALVIDEETIDDKSNVAKQLKINQDSSDTPNINAKKVAQEILIGVTASKNQQEMSKDYEWKIAGSLISKNINNSTSEIPAIVSKISCENQNENSPGERKDSRTEEGDLVSVSKLLDNAATQNPFGKYFKNDFSRNPDMLKKEIIPQPQGEGSEEDEEGLVASSGSASEGNNSGSDENKSESETAPKAPQKKKSAYSLAPNRVSCPYCHRKFPWSSSLRRHVLTHTGQKPYKCSHCSLLFTTKSNCDRHLLRKHGANSQPTLQNNSLIAASNPPNTISTPELGNQGFMMRNVPERPYKCANCPSSTFSTLSNLKKHMNFKHGIHTIDSQPNSPKQDESQSRRNSYDNEMQLTSDDEKPSKHSTMDTPKNSFESTKVDWETSKSSPSHIQDTSANTSNSDLPFKCHLCEGSYAERQSALDHIKECHESEYDLLMCKGALETGVNFNEDLRPPTPGHPGEGGEDHGDENPDQAKGKFLDYSNRKVVCAFCVRRFWSAEDLRRHMRTHTGERPFSCDVCRRRFTLKHSMLRHRKKHSTLDRCGEEPLTASGDEDIPSPISRSINATSPDPNNYHPTTSTPVSSKATNMKLLSAYQLAIHTKNMTSSPEIPNNVNNNNSPPAPSYEGKIKLQGRSCILNRKYSTDDNAQETETESSSDLIGNLLGISDRGMINKLLSSADEAAKLLGVKK